MLIAKITTHKNYTSLVFKWLSIYTLLLSLSVFLFSCQQHVEAKSKNSLENDNDIQQFITDVKVKVNAGELYDCIAIADSLNKVYTDADINIRCSIYGLYSFSYMKMNNNDLANAYVDSVIALLEQSGDLTKHQNIYINAYYRKAQLFQNEKKLSDAYKNYYKALTISREYGNKCLEANYYIRVGLILFRSKQYEAAAKFLKKAITLTKSCEPDRKTYHEESLLNNIGLSFERAGNYDSALVYYTNAVELDRSQYNKQVIEKKKRWFKISEAVVKGNLASVYSKIGKSDTAEKLFLESIAVNSKKGYARVDAQFNRIKLAELYINGKQYGKAFKLLKEVESAIKELYDKETYIHELKIRWNKAMWVYWDKLNNPAKAYKYLNVYTYIKDSIDKAQDYLSMADIDNRVNNIRQEHKISHLEEEATSGKVYLGIALLISALALVIALLVVQNAKRTRRHIHTLQDMNHQINQQKLEIKRAFDNLESADNEKDRILKAVSHDMRSPVNSALALVELILANPEELSEENKEYLELIKSSCSNALALTKDLLEVATVQSDNLETELEDVTALVKNRVGLMKFRAAEKKQAIVLKITDNHISSFVNSEKLARVINNLIANAIKFSPEGAPIYVELEDQQTNFLLKVTDKGIGIPENIRGKIFDIFTEAKRFGTSGEQPFGLGLSISKQIVEAHNGKIWFESKEGEGTTFLVSIPVKTS